MKRIGNRPITEADTDFSKLQKMPTFYTFYLHFEESWVLVPKCLQLVGKFGFAFLFYFVQFIFTQCVVYSLDQKLYLQNKSWKINERNQLGEHLLSKKEQFT